MKISFESKDEIQRISEMLQDVYPADIIFDASDAFDVTIGNNDRELPWNTDGFHTGPMMHIEFSEDKVKKPVIKEVNKKDDNPASSNDCSDCSYVAGQLDALFHCIHENKLTYGDVADVTGKSKHDIIQLYFLWIRKSMERSRDAE